ncbi:hypothetical protein [Motilibacter deserti]|uniref:HNH endonuclease n=1 Tax=Motilibacter deserti TaxID=2714956 RepID=A0ABX0GSA9_9ACTN|nr:hypothetical protein [Motilibacter deserti]NHC12569.1 hypothetical protein [Motilibacter deserti]
MSRYLYVYAGKAAKKNFNTGLNNLTWGWKQDSLGAEVDAAMDQLRALSRPTYLVFAQGVKTTDPPSGWPRTPLHHPAWRHASLNSVTVARVVRPLREDTTPLWKNDVYPYRVALDSPIELPGAPLAVRGEARIEAVHGAVHHRGMPVVGPPPLDEDDDPVPDDDEPLVPDRLLSGLEGLDGLALALVRKEQKQFRRAILGRHASLACSLCHRELPISLLRLAHIKRRADSTTAERLDSANMMPACTLGCDELFERGFVMVDETGRVVRNQKLTVATEDLNNAIARLAGKAVLGHTARMGEYFAAHASRHSRERR